MGLFSRRSKRTDETTDSGVAADEQAGDDLAAGSDTDFLDPDTTAGTGHEAPAGDASDDPSAAPARPLDRSEVADEASYVKLGSIWLVGQQGMELRLELNEKQEQITSVTAVLGESAVQLQAFAAPRTEGVWVDIRNEIAKSITDAGGTAEVVSGPFGEELQTRMPQADGAGRTVFVPARFVGSDGPRWFLRSVVSGRAAIEPASAQAIHDVIRTCVVDRGDEAMPPRELLPLSFPAQTDTPQTAEAPDADEALEDDLGDEQDQPRRVEDLKPFERGPEITEVH